MTYRAPVADIAFTLKHGAGLAPRWRKAANSPPTISTPCWRRPAGSRPTCWRRSTPSATRYGTPFKDGAVTMPPGWKEAYRAWAAAGWNAVSLPAQWGGQALPHALNAACIEMWNSASMAFGIGPVLTMGAAEALANYGIEELKQTVSAPSSCPANGWARCSSPSRRPAPTSARCAPRPCARVTAATASPGRRSSLPTASTI